jgi:lysophospholipase L1-like esterase
VTINWNTNEAANTQIEYGLTTSYGSSTAINATLLTTHSQAVTSLAANTTYHYRVKSRDAAGNLATSADFTFATADTLPPVISAVAATNATINSAMINWTTNEASDSQVEYGLTTSYGSVTALSATSVTNHSQAVTSLAANTTYHYRVKSKDAAGNLATSADASFTTPLAGSGVITSCAKIMPLGDSITLGNNGYSLNGGYRNNLYTGLLQKNCGVSFVGSQYDANTQVADKVHEGHPGWTINNISVEVTGWLNTYQPDIILLMIGTNDIAWGSADLGAAVGLRHSALIDQIQAARPNAWIFVASIPPESQTTVFPIGVDRAVLAVQLNAAINANVLMRQTAGQKIRFVDINSVLTTSDLADGIHPAEAAYSKIAQKWLYAITPLLP